MPAQARQDAILALPFPVLVESFERSLLAQNKAPKTLRAYLSACRLFYAFLLERAMPTGVEAIRREHLEAFIADQLTKVKPASAHNRYRGLRAFFNWAVDEEEIAVSPMAKMKPPIIPEDLPGVLSEEQIATLLKACAGKDYDAVRDTAIIRLLLDTGMRLTECSEIQMDRLDFTTNVVVVMGKGRRERACPFGRKTAQAIDRYLRSRLRHRDATSPFLWLGRVGRLTDDGVYQIVKKRGAKAGLELHPHLFRHTSAHRWLDDGGSETDLMALMGWRSRTMLSRYGASAAASRARASHARMGLMDRL